MPEPILTVYNRHVAGSGTPPALSNEARDLYLGYFENSQGEQWIFTFNRTTGEASLRGGDVGWEDTYPVREGQIEGLILSEEETAWLQACWKAAGA